MNDHLPGRPAGLIAALKRCGTSLLVYVPDSWLGPVVDAAQTQAGIRAVCATREEEALAICCGALFTGAKSVLLIQNVGLLSSGAAAVTLLNRFRLPLLILISQRGGLDDPRASHIPKGEAIRPVLAGLGIPYSQADPHADLEAQVAAAGQYVDEADGPFALLLCKEDLRGG